MQTIALANQKGGVGKTTTTINLGAYLAKQGNKVLIVDLDPQGNTTSGLGVDRSKIEKDLYHVLLDEVAPQKVFVHTPYDGLKLLPASTILAAAEVELVSEIAREFKLKRALRDLDIWIADMRTAAAA